MSLTNLIKTARRSIIGQNAWANLADVNTAVNDAVPYTMIGAQLNHPVGLTPTISLVSTSECPPGSGCYCKRDVLCFTIANFATGKYMITMSVPAAKGFNVLISPLSDARQNISVEVISPTQVIVTTYDIVGAVYINNAFKNTYIQFQLWN